VQCDQIGREFAIWLLFLGFLAFLTDWAVSKQGCRTFLTLKSGLALMFFTFNLSFDTFGYSFGCNYKIWAILFQSSGHSARV
jgi:hypothetical protein